MDILIVELAKDCNLVKEDSKPNGHDCWGNLEFTSQQYVWIGDKKENVWNEWYVIHDGTNVKEISSLKPRNISYQENVSWSAYGWCPSTEKDFNNPKEGVEYRMVILPSVTKPSPPNMEGWAKVGIKSNSDQSLREVENTNKETLQILELHLGSDYYKLAGFTANIANAMDEHSFKVAGRAFVAGRSKSSWGQFIIDENDRITSTPPQPTEKADKTTLQGLLLRIKQRAYLDTDEQLCKWVQDYCDSENDFLREDIKALQSQLSKKEIELSNYAYQMDMAKRERDRAESQIEEQKKERDNAVNQYLDQRGLNSNLVLELERVRKERDELLVKINTPEIDDFIEGVKLEAAHQTERWGLEKEENEPPHHYILVGSKLLGKLSVAIFDRDADKFKHHCITLAAVMHNCHRQVVKDGTVINYYFESLKQDNNNNS